MEEQKSNKSLIVIIIVSVLIILGLVGYIVYGFMDWNETKPTTTPTATSTPTAAPTATMTLTPTVTPTPPSSSASEVVDDFTKYTLGTIPDASLDYEAAKLLMTSTYRSQFTDDSFIPITYCIQQGPDSIQILAETIMGDAMSVEVQGSWGGSDGTTWDFILVNDGSGWKIDQIICSLG